VPTVQPRLDGRPVALLRELRVLAREAVALEHFRDAGELFLADADPLGDLLVLLVEGYLPAVRRVVAP
jgi:hypothetical protein